MSRTLFCRSLRTTSLATGLALALAMTDTDAFAWGLGGGHRQPDDVARGVPPSGRAIPTRTLAPLWRPLVPVLPVTNCDDDGGTGTLRSVVAGAPSGAIVDLSALTCSTISLANGAIAVPAESLHIKGPVTTLTLAANQSYRRIIQHSGHGTLSLSHLTLTGGWAGIGSPAYGGCLYSAGSIELDHAAVIFCKAVGGVGQKAKGGGIYAAGSLTLHHSNVSGNETNPGIVGYGGGAFAAGALYADYSTISGNYSLNLYDGDGFGGGLFTFGKVNIVSSTISGNHAVNVGGLSIAGYATSAVIVDSTISGNLASNFMGGVYSNTPLSIYNSTIAFNNAGQQSSSVVTAAGVQIFATSADLQSSIIAGNTVGSFSFDFGEQSGSVSGANNLVRTSSGLMPAGTITDDPQLLALQDNGGETATHALAAASPAIDHGNVVNPSANDQRGPGYARVVGVGADIGAFERQTFDGDLIFRNGFDGP